MHNSAEFKLADAEVARTVIEALIARSEKRYREEILTPFGLPSGKMHKIFDDEID